MSVFEVRILPKDATAYMTVHMEAPGQMVGAKDYIENLARSYYEPHGTVVLSVEQVPDPWLALSTGDQGQDDA